MATVYKRKELRTIPEGATRTTYRGKPYVTWTDSKGRMQRAPLNPVGDRIIQEADIYSCMYFDERGNRRQVTTGCRDKATALPVANKLETDVALRKRGHIDAGQERLAKEARRVIDEHLADFQAAMQSAARTANHIETTIGFVQMIADAAGWQNLAAELVKHIATKAPAARVFNMPAKWDVAPMFRADLTDARRAWLDAAHGSAERLRREQSDFLAYAEPRRGKGGLPRPAAYDRGMVGDGRGTPQGSANRYEAFCYQPNDGYLRAFVPRTGRGGGGSPARHDERSPGRPRGTAGDGDGWRGGR